eukprot:TRINITY_DN1058_c0_g2_i1.p1 TRINITY_DN1058_c0_g2~~TRINITY_DN1058_c0_g2_i1.p1  ORF type:complete len:450 (+),score=76.05 TRINITY_DN1058_c0_g2_i1:62-1411(+)
MSDSLQVQSCPEAYPSVEPLSLGSYRSEGAPLKMRRGMVNSDVGIQRPTEVSSFVRPRSNSVPSSECSTTSTCEEVRRSRTLETATRSLTSPGISKGVKRSLSEADAGRTRGDSEPNEGDNLAKRSIYIDRISPILSDGAIRRAINQGISPHGVEKVEELEVIRTQSSRHVHAFALLTTEYGSCNEAVEIPVETGDYIKVQLASKELQFDDKPKPCRTLHLRLYSLKNMWAETVGKMTWSGLLSILEVISPGVCDRIIMVADDRSARSNLSHSSVLLAVFFVECKSLEDAVLVRQAVHDMSTQTIDDHRFLVRADFSTHDKKLHDTSENKDQLKELFLTSRSFAQTVQSDPSLWSPCDCSIPAMHGKCIHTMFEFKKAKGKRWNRKRSARNSNVDPVAEPTPGVPSPSKGHAPSRISSNPCLPNELLNLGLQQRPMWSTEPQQHQPYRY